MKENINYDEKNDAVSCARQSLILFWKAIELVIGCGDSWPPTSDSVIPTLPVCRQSQTDRKTVTEDCTMFCVTVDGRVANYARVGCLPLTIQPLYISYIRGYIATVRQTL